MTRHCDWCALELPAGARSDSIVCSKRCRQARHRFVTDVGRAPLLVDARPLRIAYADPPYPGLSKKYYEGHADYAGEVDHVELLSRLDREFDCWALSTSAAALPELLRVAPAGVRVASWHRGERPTIASLPLNAWEPVIYYGARRILPLGSAHDGSRLAAARHDVSTTRGSARRLDVLEHFSRPRHTDPARVVGAKPARFLGWLLELLGATHGDSLTDLYPGSGGVDRAWRYFTR